MAIIAPEILAHIDGKQKGRTIGIVDAQHTEDADSIMAVRIGWVDGRIVLNEADQLLNDMICAIIIESVFAVRLPTCKDGIVDYVGDFMVNKWIATHIVHCLHANAKLYVRIVIQNWVVLGVECLAEYHLNECICSHDGHLICLNVGLLRHLRVVL